MTMPAPTVVETAIRAQRLVEKLLIVIKNRPSEREDLDAAIAAWRSLDGPMRDLAARLDELFERDDARLEAADEEAEYGDGFLD